MNSNPGTVFLFLDNASVRNQISQALTATGIWVREISDLMQLDAYGDETQCCVITTVSCDPANPFSALIAIQSRFPRLPVMLIVERPSTRQTVAAMKRGAFAVLDSMFDRSDLIGFVSAAFDSNQKILGQVQQLDELKRRFGALSEREKRVMDYIVDGKANKVIARSLNVSHRTVDRVRARVFQKLGAETAVDLARMVTEIRVRQEELEMGADRSVTKAPRFRFDEAATTTAPFASHSSLSSVNHATPAYR